MSENIKAPVTDWKVDIDTFEGPLDLLLHLIRSKNLDIYDIPIARITSEYLKYVEIIKHLDLDNVGEFIVMAAVLVRIKSRMLLPQLEPDAQEEESAEDLKQNLIQRLLEYKRYKDASEFFIGKEQAYENVFPLHQYPIGEFGEEVEATLFDLIDAFSALIESAKKDVKDIIAEELSVEDKIRFILGLIDKSQESLSITDFIENKNSVLDLIVTLLALLELARMHQVRILQAARFGAIYVEKGEGNNG